MYIIIYTHTYIFVYIYVYHRYRRSVDCFLIDQSIFHGRYRRSMSIHLLENTVDIDSRCRFTYLRIRLISTVDTDLPVWKYGRYCMDRQFQKKIGRNRPSQWIHTNKNQSTAFFRKVKKKDYWPMVPKVVRNGPGHTSTKKSWSMRGEKWSQHLSKYRHLSTDLSTRSIGHGRYRRSMPIKQRENMVDIDGRYQFTYGELQSIVD